jgi:hypothetical protein
VRPAQILGNGVKTGRLATLGYLLTLPDIT